jgi:hypothetical protein
VKAIVHYYEVSLDEALAHVRLVVEEGRVSRNGEQFCYVTHFSDGVLVFADQTRTGTDTFTVQPAPEDTNA